MNLTMLLHWKNAAKWRFFICSSIQTFTEYWNPILLFQMLLSRFWAKYANALIAIRKENTLHITYILHIIISFMVHPNSDHLPFDWFKRETSLVLCIVCVCYVHFILFKMNGLLNMISWTFSRARCWRLIFRQMKKWSSFITI